MNAWATLETELDAWAETGRTAQVWWRDDDAAAATPAFERLLQLAAGTGAPLALAVIPASAEPALARQVADQPADVTVLQHGFAHADHAPAAAKKCELVSPAARPAGIDELCQGHERLGRLFGQRFRPVLVPPWNRIADDLVARLPALGFGGLSTYKARGAASPAPGLHQVNCHLDILQWRPTRRFLGTQAALDLLTGHLAAKRQGAADAAEPSGILSHHLVHDDAAWDFLKELLERLARHAGASLLPAGTIFEGAPS
ncbi:MAG: polysaccharide deacetylase family protein [Kiloniellaceae bacterium]